VNINPHPAPSASWAQPGPELDSTPQLLDSTPQLLEHSTPQVPAKTHKCDHPGCSETFTTLHGVNTHKYRKHTAKGRAWGKRLRTANRAKPAAKKPVKKATAKKATVKKATVKKAAVKPSAKKSGKKIDTRGNTVVAFDWKAMDASAMAQAEKLVLRVGNVTVSNSGNLTEITIGPGIVSTQSTD
jgi:hypothetical protein